MPVTIWDLITQLAGLQPPPETGPVGPFPGGMTPGLENWLAVLGERDMGIGPLAQQFPVGYGLQSPARFHPQVPLDPSQVEDRRPWWGFTLPRAPFYDPVPQWQPNPFAVGLPMGEWAWPPGGGYPSGP